MSSAAGVMRTPRSLDLELTGRCNARCLYCYYLDNEGVGYGELSTAAWLELLAELGEAQVLSVCLSGGEALVRDDFFDLVDGVVRNRMRFDLLTNGRLVDADVARRLKATGRCNYVQVSLDGSCAAVHESMRGAGSFAPAVDAIVALRDAGLPVAVRATLHARNIDDLPALTRFLLEDLGLPSFSTNAVSSVGTAEKYEGLLLSARDRLRAMQVLAELEQAHPGRITAAAGPLAEWRMFNEMRAAAAAGHGIPGRGSLVGCGCVFEKMAVRSDGAYIPCVMLPQQVLGQAGRDRLEDVWQNAPSIVALRERRAISLASLAECAGCRYVDSCTGNCPGSALSLIGRTDRPGPDACLRRFEGELAREGTAW